MDTWTILLAAASLALALAGGLWLHTAKGRGHQRLRQRFGPEYDREVERQGSVEKAELELAARTKRVENLDIRALSAEQRDTFANAWDRVQARFVDEPQIAIQAADDLVGDVMVARGYTHADFDQRVADLSVGHASVIHHYRTAHELAQMNREGRATTERLRQAVIHYRALIAELIGHSRSSLETPKEVHS